MIGRKVIGLKEVYLLMIARLPKYFYLGSDIMKNLKFLSVILISLFISVIFFSNNSYAAVSDNSFLDKATSSELIRFKSFSSIQDYLKKVNKNSSYNQVQSFCTDGKYFYVACLTRTYIDSEEPEKKYTDQETTILKINMKTEKIVASAYLGKIGHSNSLSYNNLNNTILIAPCNKRGIVYKISANFSKFKTKITPDPINLKLKERTDSKGNKVVPIVTSIAYNEGRNVYLMKISSNTIAWLDSEFKELYSVTFKNGKKTENSLRGFGDTEHNYHVGQSIYADCSYIYALYNVGDANSFKNKNFSNIKNYVDVFDYNGDYVKTLQIPIQGFELEEIYYSNGSFYTAGTNEKTSPKGFSIFKIDIKNQNKFDVSYLDPNSNTNFYQSIKTGDENHTTKLLKINSQSKTLKGYKAYRDYDNSWLVTVNNNTQWLTRAEIKKAKNEGKTVYYKLYSPNGSVYHTVKGGNSVLMIAQWK